LLPDATDTDPKGGKCPLDREEEGRGEANDYDGVV
jgi:hypothetical protein